VLSEVAALGFQRVTFAGGEPLLAPHIDELVQAAKHRFGLRTSIVTNGSLLSLDRCICLSIHLFLVARHADDFACK
jgi:MoaA/NifB/PqqE/SkfB family radical SAM enzyme